MQNAKNHPQGGECLAELIAEATSLLEKIQRLGKKSQGVEEKDAESGGMVWVPDHPTDHEISELAQRLKVFVPKLRDTLARFPLLSGTREMVEQLPLVANLVEVMSVFFYPLDLRSALSGTWPTAVYNLTTIITLLENGSRLNRCRQPEGTVPEPERLTKGRKTAGRDRLSSTITSHDAVKRMVAYITSMDMSLAEFAKQAKTSDRTLRSFRKRGKVRRDIFDGIARAMGLTREQLLKPE